VSAEALLTVVVPVYNGGALLRECLESVTREVTALSDDERAQVEVIVSDNHSGDRSGHLAAEVVTPAGGSVVSPPAHLASRTAHWQFALGEGSGTWLLMLHADDRLEPGSLHGLLRATRLARATDVLISGRYRTLSDAPTTRPR
jgi:glycosyltransferase involved in cell wall biosynthesis